MNNIKCLKYSIHYVDLAMVRHISEYAIFPIFRSDILNKCFHASLPLPTSTTPFCCPLMNISEFVGKGFEKSLTHILKPWNN